MMAQRPPVRFFSGGAGEIPAAGFREQSQGYLEDATNATAGIIVTRPWAITRLTGI
ncbi:hypothetical protein [Morganella morganii]|uniref:hypothetical protein n=1 Tax=Morganella morganii TaxID=582 RepID=UPI00324CE3CC